MNKNMEQLEPNRLSSEDAYEQYKNGEMRAEDYMRNYMRPENLKSQYVIGGNDGKEEAISDPVRLAVPENSNTDMFLESSSEAISTVTEDAPEGLSLEKAADNLEKLEREIDTLYATISILEKSGTEDDETAIELIKKEIESREGKKEEAEAVFEIAVLEKRVSDLKKTLSENKAAAMGLNEDEVVQAATETKKEIEKIQTETSSKTETVSSNSVARSEAVPVENKGDILPSECSGLFKQTYENERKKQEGKSKWGWIKERLKGFLTIGFWELDQAERFRRNANATSEDITIEARKIQQTDVLDLDAAHEEAMRMKELADKEGKFGNKQISSKDIERYSKAITEVKKGENSALINTIINQATIDLERQLEGYKDEYGDSAVSVEKLDAFRLRLRKELEALQKGFLFKEELAGAGELAKSRPSKVREAILADQEAFKRTIRESLDPKYWKRYIYVIPGSFLIKKIRSI